MGIRRILTYPDTVLQEPAETVTNINGLASNQVGEPWRIIVFDTSAKEEPKSPIVVINPEIVETDGVIVSEEGCLSVIDYCADVKRSHCVTVRGVDREGEPLILNREGLSAIVLQHEIDHLDGVLFIHRISKLKRELYKRRLKKILKKQQVALQKL